MKFFLLVLFLPSVLYAEENSTYNFYFQKAPGPAIVNQVSTAAPQPSSIQTPNLTVAIPSNPEAAVKTTLSTGYPEKSKRGPFYFAMGYSIFRSKPDSSLQKLASGESLYFDRQLSLNFEYDIQTLISVFAELRVPDRLLSSPMYIRTEYDSQGKALGAIDPNELAQWRARPLDYSAGALLNILRFGSARNAGVTLSLEGGIQTIPYIKYKRVSETMAIFKELRHDQNLFVGARARLLFFEKAGFDFVYRYLTKINNAEIKMAFAMAF